MPSAPRPAGPEGALAATFVVNDFTDPGDGACGDGSCTLRDAITAANDLPGEDTINFSSGGTIVLSAVLPVITDTLTIDGSAAAVTVDGAGLHRVLRSTAPFTLTALTVQNGYAEGDGAGALFGGPGAVIDAYFYNNAADGFGGGAFFQSAATITGTTFLSNTAGLDGGGAHTSSEVIITGSLFYTNTAPNGSGGGAYFSTMATVTDSDFMYNTAQLGGGARFGGHGHVSGGTFSGNQATNGDGGGARFGANATVTGTTFTGNSAAGSGRGGGARFDGVTTLAGASFVGNQAQFGGGGADFFQEATIWDTTFTGNTSVGGGGGGARFDAGVVMWDALFTHNTATNNDGGGAAFTEQATLTNTLFAHNAAPLGSGGGARFDNEATLSSTDFLTNTALVGGGARIGGRAIVSTSTFQANTATNGNGGGARFGNIASVTDSDFVGNNASSHGGGAYFANAATVTASAFLRNQALNGGGLAIGPSASAALDNNLLAKNTVLSATAGAEIALLGNDARVYARHNTLGAASVGSGVALVDEASAVEQAAVLTNTIFHGYAVGVRADAAAPAMTLVGVLWSSVTTPTEGAGFAVTNAVTGGANFVDPGQDNYRVQRPSAAIDAGQDAGLADDFEGDVRPQNAGFELGYDEARNIAPTAVADTTSTLEDTAVTVSVLGNDEDVDGDALAVTEAETPAGGSAVISGTTQVVFTPPADFHGEIAFTYMVSDGALATEATVTVTVTAVNDPPTITGPGDVALVIGGSSGPMGFTVNDVELGGAITVTAMSTNTVLVPNANIVLSGTGTNRTVTITAAHGELGQARIMLTVTDDHGETAEASFLVDVDYRLYFPFVRQ